MTDCLGRAARALLCLLVFGAVMGWQYEPTQLDGRPVPVVMTVSVSFELR